MNTQKPSSVKSTSISIQPSRRDVLIAIGMTVEKSEGKGFILSISIPKN